MWPLALAVEALTSSDPKEQARILRALLKLQCGNGLMHESVNKDDLSRCTRPIFEWANAMLVTLVEGLLGWHCEEAAEQQRLAAIKVGRLGGCQWVGVPGGRGRSPGTPDGGGGTGLAVVASPRHE